MHEFELIYQNYLNKLKFKNQITKSYEVEINKLFPYYEHYLFDGFGTLYTDDKVFQDAVNLISHLRTLKKEVRLVTNAASRTRLELADKLLKIGIPFHPNEIISSGSLLANLNRPKKFNQVFHIGRASGLKVLAEAKIEHLECPKEPIVVMTGMPEVGMSDSMMSKLINLLSKPNAQLILLNPDVIAPSKNGIIRVAGYWAQKLHEKTSCNLLYLGKPFPLIFEKAIYSLFPKKGSSLMIGDSLWTDIVGAQSFGIDCALLNRGISKEYGSENNSEIRANYYLKNLKF